MEQILQLYMEQLKKQQEKKEDYLKKYFLLKYLYGGKEEDFVQFKKTYRWNGR